MKLSSVNIVLVATTHPGNIGASARAMKNMGFSRLTLVSPKFFPDEKATEMASGADDILKNARVVSRLSEALADSHLVIGTSARERHLELPLLSPSSCAAMLAEQMEDMEVALVFGREHAGLTNEELMQCHFHVMIEGNPEYGSLNLSQAVQIMTYTLRKTFLTEEEKTPNSRDLPATAQEMEYFYTHLETVMREVGFVSQSNRVMDRMRRLFSRIHPEDKEVAMLRGFLTEIQKTIKGRK